MPTIFRVEVVDGVLVMGNFWLRWSLQVDLLGFLRGLYFASLIAG